MFRYKHKHTDARDNIHFMSRQLHMEKKQQIQFTINNKTELHGESREKKNQRCTFQVSVNVANERSFAELQSAATAPYSVVIIDFWSFQCLIVQNNCILSRAVK